MRRGPVLNLVVWKVISSEVDLSRDLNEEVSSFDPRDPEGGSTQ